MANYSVITNGTNTNPFMGPNYAPQNGNAGTNPNNWGFGNSSNFVRPYQNFSWRLQTQTWALGAFCKAHDYIDTIDNVCLDGAFGRLKISTKSPNLGQLGFVTQHWYNWTDGPFNLLNDYPTFEEWWDNCTTVTIQVPNLMYTRSNGTRATVLVDVAYIGRDEADYVDDTPDSDTNTGGLVETEYPGLDEDWDGGGDPDRWSGGSLGEGDNLIARTPKFNPSLMNYLDKCYGYACASWYQDNPGHPMHRNPFLPAGAYVPLSALPSDGEDIAGLGEDNPWMAAVNDQNGYETAGLTSAEGRMLIGICQAMPRNHPAAVNARYNLMKNCSPGDINKLSLMGVL